MALSEEEMNILRDTNAQLHLHVIPVIEQLVKGQERTNDHLSELNGNVAKCFQTDAVHETKICDLERRMDTSEDDRQWLNRKLEWKLGWGKAMQITIIGIAITVASFFYLHVIAGVI